MRSYRRVAMILVRLLETDMIERVLVLSRVVLGEQWGTQLMVTFGWRL